MAGRRADLEAGGLVRVRAELIRSAAWLDTAQVRALYATWPSSCAGGQPGPAAVLDRLEHLVADRFSGYVERRFLNAIHLGRNP